jgi:hypothetical protein
MERCFEWCQNILALNSSLLLIATVKLVFLSFHNKTYGLIVGNNRVFLFFIRKEQKILSWSPGIV